MKDINKSIIAQFDKDYTTYCDMHGCETCKFYYVDTDCKFAFGILHALGKMKIKFDDSEV